MTAYQRKVNQNGVIQQMKANQVVYELLKLRGYTITYLASKLGYKTQSMLSDKLNRNAHGMRVDKLQEILAELDCEIVIRSKAKDKKEWVLTLNDAGAESK